MRISILLILASNLALAQINYEVISCQSDYAGKTENLSIASVEMKYVPERKNLIVKSSFLNEEFILVKQLERYDPGEETGYDQATIWSCLSSSMNEVHIHFYVDTNGKDYPGLYISYNDPLQKNYLFIYQVD